MNGIECGPSSAGAVGVGGNSRSTAPLKIWWNNSVELRVYVDDRECPLPDEEAGRIYNEIVNKISGLEPVAVFKGQKTPFGHFEVTLYMADNAVIRRETWQPKPGYAWEEEYIEVLAVPEELIKVARRINTKLDRFYVDIGGGRGNILLEGAVEEAILNAISDWVWGEFNKDASGFRVDKPIERLHELKNVAAVLYSRADEKKFYVQIFYRAHVFNDVRLQFRAVVTPTIF